MIKLLNSLFLVFLLTLVYVQSNGQAAPSGIVFQAVARDINNNAAANRNVFAIVNIIEGTVNGTNVYKESFQVVSTNEGVFTITIGQGNRVSGASSLLSLNWLNKTYFANIQIAIQPTLPDPSWTPTNNYLDIGTTQFWSVPYAITALNSKFADSSLTINSILPGSKGGTGINNNGKSITLGNNIITKGIGDLTITTTAASNVIFPVSGTLANTQYVSDRIATDTMSLSGRIIRDSILITKNNQGIIDTAAAIRLKLLDKIEASQFPNLIQPFLANTIYSFKDTITLSNRINTKLNISDTSGMLSSRIGRDTISLSNRIESIKTTNNVSTNLKLNISDTSIMLSNRIGRDTIELSNRINRNSILIANNKQAIIDTAAAIRLKLNDKIEASQFPNLIQPFLAGTIFSFNDTMTLSNRINAKLNAVDTAALSTWKLNKADTAAMLSRYLTGIIALNADTATLGARFSDVVSLANTKVKYSDTAAMLSNYLAALNNLRSTKLNAADTATLGARFSDVVNLANAKVKYSDTAAMLSNYLAALNNLRSTKLNAVDTAALSTWKLNKADTASMLSSRIGRDTVGLSNRIIRDSILITKNKQGIIDTAVAIRLKLNDKIEISQFPNLIQPFLAGTIFSFNDTITLSNRINAKLNAVDTAALSTWKLNKADTAAMLSSYLTGLIALNADTATLGARFSDLVSLANTKVKYSDTAAMLSNYLAALNNLRSTKLNAVDTAALSTWKLNKADTAAMLSSYLTGLIALNADTATLGARFSDVVSLANTKVKYSDTAAMLSNYLAALNNLRSTKLNAVDTAALSTWKLNKADTAAMLSKYLTGIISLNADTATLGARFSDVVSLANTKVKYTDTAAMLSNYLAALNNLRSTKLNAVDTAALSTWKLNKADTAAMLSSYLTGLIALNADTATLGARFGDVVSLANTKVKYSDTATILNKYLTGLIALNADTATLGARFSDVVSLANTKVKYTDTAAMLSNYLAALNNLRSTKLNAVDTAALSTWKLNKADTAAMLSSYLTGIISLNADTATLGARFGDIVSLANTKVKYSDTAAMLSSYLTGIIALDTRITSNTASITTNIADILLRATIASPSFTGTPTAPTAASGTSTTQIATTEFVSTLVGGSGAPNATATVKGILKLTNDLGGTADFPTVNSVGGVVSSTITTLPTLIASNTASITTEITRATNAENDLSTRITSNTSSITSNTSAIAGLDTRVTSNTASITANTTDIASLNTRVTSNTSSITANTVDIASNTASITANTSAIAGLDTRVTSNTTSITSNTSAIAGLDTRVTSNTASITANTTDIASLNTRVTSNTSSITSNTADIASNTASITSNTSAIAALDTRVTSNTSTITANTADIASNTASITAEITRATSAEAALSTRTTSNTSSITAEITRATNAEAALDTRITSNTSSITAEITRATNAEAALSTRITSNTSSITSEITRATNAEAALDTRITSNTSSITANTATIASNTSSITAEITRATSAEAALSTRITSNTSSITAEITRATNAEAALDTRVTSNTASITAEITRATNAENALSTRITSNTSSITANTADIASNTTSITAEITRATNAEAALSTRISSNTSSITAEITRATNAESALDTRITSNTASITANTAAIASNTSSITAEITRATNAEAALSTRITSNTSSITAEITRATNAEAALDTRVTSNTSSITANTADIASNTASITAEITRATSAEAALSTRITSNTSSITAEITRATNAEAALDTRITSNTSSITAEITRATSAEAALSTRVTSNTSSITAEITRATNAEAALDTRVTSNTASITTNTADILLRATIASPSFTGTPTVPKATTGSNNDQIANTAFVKTAIDGISIGAGQFTGIMPVANGGTGQSSFTDGQLLIGNTTGNTLTKSTLTAGNGVSITNGNGSITIAATGTGGTVTNVNPITVTASGNTFTSTVTNATSTPAINLTIPLASVAGTTAGLLSKVDYDVFNAKQNALIAGTNYIAPNAAITGATKTKITYDEKGLVTAGADATTADIAPSTNRNYVTDIKAGVLSNTSGVNTGDQTIILTGDVTGTGTGTFTSTIANAAVTYAKMQNVTAGKLLGSISASDAAPGAVAIGSGLSLSGGTLTASGTGGTVTSVSPITVTASGSTFTSTVTNASTTPAISLTIPLASVSGTTAGLLSNTDYATFNAKQGALTAGSGISIASNTISATGLTTSNLSSTAGILNGQLANSAITLGSTSMSLGSTNTTIAGLTSVTSTGFTGALTGNASTATALATARSIYGNNFDGTAALSGVISTTFGGTGASSTSQNFVFAGPTSGAGAPGFRLLTSADVPAGSGNYIANGTTQQASSNFNISGSGVVGTSLSAGSLSLTTALSVANGGTGATTLSGLVKGNGTSAMTAAVAGTDFVAPNSAITAATKTKLTYDTKGLVTAGADATTADIAPSTDRNYVTDIKVGVLSNTSGVNSGDQTITLTGDVTGTGTGTFTSTIANSAVTYAKMQNLTAGKLLGSISGSDAAPGAVAIGSGLTLSGGTLTASGTGGTVTYVNPITLTTTGSTFTSTVANASTTPAITLNIPSASVSGTTAGLLSNTDYAIFNAKQSALTLGTGMQTFLSTPTSANLANTISDETGSGSLVFATSPTLQTPVLGNATATSLSSGTLSLTAALTAANGGTSQSTYATGDILYASATNTLSKLGIGATGTVLTVSGGVPSWGSSSGITGTGTQNYLPKYNNAGGTTLGNSLIFDNGTSVGINTASPGSTFKLDVNGAANFASDIVVNGIKIGKRLDPGYEMYATSYGVNALANFVVGAFGATAFGNNALQANTNGAYNNAFGIGTLFSLTTGSGNTAIGSYASYETSDASNNVIIGHEAGRYLNTADNTIIGYRAGQTCCTTNSVNIKNTYIGSGSGNGTAGSKNVIIGSFSGSGLGTINNNIILSDGDGTIRYRWDGTTNNFNTGSVTASSFIKSGGSSSQYLMADGSVSSGPSGGVTTISGGTTGLTPSSATSGVVTLAGTLAAANGGTGQSTYVTGDILYASAANTLSKLGIGAPGTVLTVSGGIPSWGSNGLYSLNGITSGTHSFATGTNGTDFNISSSGSTHTFNIPDAGATSTTRGLVNIGAQTFYGNKTFNGGTTSVVSLSASGIVNTANLYTTNLKVTGGTLTAGRVLTSDANGNATWQAASAGITGVGTITTTSYAEGAAVSGNSLILAPANATNGGILTSGTQTIGGQKSFDKAVTNSVAYNASAGTTIDFSNSNLAYTSANPGNTFTLSNMKDGGTYTLAVRGTTSGTAAFTASGFTIVSLGNYSTISGKRTIYTFVVMGTEVYYSMISEQ